MINAIKTAASICGGAIGYFLGGFDGFLITLIILMVVDYITGVIAAWKDKSLNSKVGFTGIGRKVVILLLIGIANLLDVNILGGSAVLRTATIFFYISNEGLSILENSGKLGLPLPAPLVAALEQLKDNKKK